MKTTYQTPQAIEHAIANSMNPYKIKDLKNQLSWMKAEEAGKFITKEHLVEYRNLIIFIAKKSLYFQSNYAIDLRSLMNTLLSVVNANELVYRTEKGVKGIIVSAVKSIASGINMNRVEESEGSEIWTNNNLRAEGSLFYNVKTFNLNNSIN